MSAPFCVHCTTGYAIPGTPTGRMEKLGPYDTYIASPTTGTPVDPTRAIFFACDAFGLSLINNKLLPDQMANRLNCNVYVPDYFEGKGVQPNKLQMPATAKEMRGQTFLQKIGAGVGMLSIAPWFISNRPATKLAPLEKWFKAVEESKGVKEWGSVGYCYGAKPSLHFSSQSKFKAQVLAHPSFVAIDDIKRMQGPTLFLCADEDPVFTAGLREQSQKVLLEERKGEIEVEFKVFDNTVHGFAARPDLSVPEVKKAFEEALELTVGWFEKYLVEGEGKAGDGGAAAAAAASA